MSQVDYTTMSDAMLKEHFLKHRGNKAVFQAYMDRINQRPLRVVAGHDDPDFEQKVQAAILQKLEVTKSLKQQE